MNKKNSLILAIVLIAVVGILGTKFYYGNTQQPLNAPAFVDQALTEHKPLWLLFRSQT